MKFFVPCAKGLEYLLADEVIALGAEHAAAAVAGVAVEGSSRLPYRVLLGSRLASRALWPLVEFDCPDQDALYEGAGSIDWSEHIDIDSRFVVDATVSGPTITHGHYAALRVKDAIVDQFRMRSGDRPSIDTEAPDLRINLSIRKGRAVLSIDLGGPLHRRGWRTIQGSAPLKETVAAAVLLRGGWPRVYAEGGCLLDPMCGSGTLLIEAAELAAGIAPGLRRHGERLPTAWKGFDAALWHGERQQALAAAEHGRHRLRACFHGRDIDPHAIRAMRANVEAAGLAEFIVGECGDIVDLTVPVDCRSGLVVCNPPYDRRLSADPGLYRELGSTVQRLLPDWRAAILAGDRELARATGLRARKVYPIHNGAIECALLVCDRLDSGDRRRSETAGDRSAGDLAGDSAGGSAADPASGRHLLDEGATMVANRLRKNLRALARWRSRAGVECFRVYDADLPEYAAAIDVYREDGDAGRVFLHVQEYQAPRSIPEADSRRRLHALLAAARSVFDLPESQIALKTRTRAKGGGKYGRMDHRAELIVVREGDARLRVNLFDYLDTGLFLDHRPLRRRLREQAGETRFLNLFAYTGAATVQAALAGARTTTSVDLSATYLEWAAGNLALNACTGPRHRLIQADVMTWLAAERDQYDLIFCDPPTFSNSARAGDFDVQAQHVDLLRRACARLAPGGVLLFSNNYRRFRLDDQAVATFAQAREISTDSLDPDFARNPRIHRVWELRAMPG